MNDPRRSPLFMALLIASTAIGPFAMQIFVPALPAIQADFGVPIAQAQLALSLSALAIALSTLIYGPLADRHGRRPVLIASLVLFLAGSLVCTLAQSIGSFILGRIVQAAGGAGGMVIARTMVRDLFGREQSAQVLAYLTMAMVVAPMVGPAVGGVLIDLLGWRAIFVLTTFLGVLVTVGVVTRLVETRGEVMPFSGIGGMLQSFALLLRQPMFRGYAFQSSFSLGLFYAFLAGAPFVVVGILGRPASEYGFYFILISGGFMAGNFMTARFARRIGIDRMIIAGSLLALAGTLVMLALALSRPWASAAIFVPTAFVAFAQGMSMPSAQAGALSIEPRLAGSAAGLSGFMQMFVAAVLAQAVGMLQDDTPYAMISIMTASAAIALVSIAVPLARARRRGL